MRVLKIVFSIVAAILIVNGCNLKTAHVQAKDKSVEDWLEKKDGHQKQNVDSNKSTDTDQTTKEANEPDSSLLFNLIKVVITLAIILFLIYYVVKFLNRRNKLLQKVKAMENLGGISVGANKSVQIVRIGQQLYMLGVGDNVELLKEINDEDTKKSILQQEETENERKHDITSVLPFVRKTKQPSDDAEVTANFKEQFLNELDSMRENRLRIMEQHQKENEHE